MEQKRDGVHIMRSIADASCVVRRSRLTSRQLPRGGQRHTATGPGSHLCLRPRKQKRLCLRPRRPKRPCLRPRKQKRLCLRPRRQRRPCLRPRRHKSPRARKRPRGYVRSADDVVRQRLLYASTRGSATHDTLTIAVHRPDKQSGRFQAANFFEL